MRRSPLHGDHHVGCRIHKSNVGTSFGVVNAVSSFLLVGDSLFLQIATVSCLWAALKRDHFRGICKCSAKIFTAGSNISFSLRDIFANLYKGSRPPRSKSRYRATTWNRIAALQK